MVLHIYMIYIHIICMTNDLTFDFLPCCKILIFTVLLGTFLCFGYLKRKTLSKI